jgi:hypothetical protein
LDAALVHSCAQVRVKIAICDLVGHLCPEVFAIAIVMIFLANRSPQWFYGVRSKGLAVSCLAFVPTRLRIGDWFFRFLRVRKCCSKLQLKRGRIKR